MLALKSFLFVSVFLTQFSSFTTVLRAPNQEVLACPTLLQLRAALLCQNQEPLIDFLNKALATKSLNERHLTVAKQLGSPERYALVLATFEDQQKKEG